MQYDVNTASALSNTLRKKAKEMTEAAKDEWSGEALHILIGDFAGYITGVADGIDFLLSLEKQEEEEE